MKREPSGVVLYVEDNRVNFLLVEQLLSIWSLVELHHAEDGARALELEPAFARVRVAVLSASAMPGDIAAARPSACAALRARSCPGDAGRGTCNACWSHESSRSVATHRACSTAVYR